MDQITLNTIVLQTATSCYEEGNDIMGCIADDAVAPFGTALFGLLVAGGMILGIWFAGDGDLATPAVLAILLGGIFLPFLSGGYVRIAQMFMFIGLVAALLAVAQKYVMSTV